MDRAGGCTPSATKTEAQVSASEQAAAPKEQGRGPGTVGNFRAIAGGAGAASVVVRTARFDEDFDGQLAGSAEIQD